MSLTRSSVQELGNDRRYARKVAVEHDERKWILIVLLHVHD